MRKRKNGIIQAVYERYAKARGFFGSMAIKGMNAGHAKVAERRIQRFPAVTSETVIGLGCGAAALVGHYPQAQVTAVDYLPLSWWLKRNPIIGGPQRKGVVRFNGGMHWHRILKSGGIFAIVNETDRIDVESLKYEQMIDGMKDYTVPQITACMAAGFSNIHAGHHEKHPGLWCIVKNRPVDLKQSKSLPRVLWGRH